MTARQPAGQSPAPAWCARPQGWAGWAPGWKAPTARCYRRSSRLLRSRRRGSRVSCGPRPVSYRVPRLFAHEGVQLNSDAEQVAELSKARVTSLIGRADIHLVECVASLNLIQLVRRGAGLDASLAGHAIQLREDGRKNGAAVRGVLGQEAVAFLARAFGLGHQGFGLLAVGLDGGKLLLQIDLFAGHVFGRATPRLEG